MEAAAYKRLYPHEYYAKFIAEDARPDGRPLGRARPMSVAKGVVTTANGSALVKVGRTSVLAAVKLEPVAPELDTPGEGMLEVNVELPPMCSAATRPGRPSEEAHYVTRRVSDALRDAKVLDLTQLCIKEGVFVWKVCVDVYCLDHDGSVLDAALAACVGALRDCAVPFVAVDERGKLSWGGAGKRKRGEAQQEGEGGEGAGVEGAAGEDADASTSAACVVEVHHTPFSLTTGLYKLIVDPDAEEEALMDAVVSVAMTEDGQLVGVLKPGGTAEASETTLMHCVAAAKVRLYKLIAVDDP